MNLQYATQLPPAWLPIADVFAALGDENRQKIVLLFEYGEELSIKNIVDAMPLSRTATVHHLTALKNANIISCRRKGKAVLYSLNEETVLHAMAMVQEYIANRKPQAEPPPTP